MLDMRTNALCISSSGEFNMAATTIFKKATLGSSRWLRAVA